MSEQWTYRGRKYSSISHAESYRVVTSLFCLFSVLQYTEICLEKCFRLDQFFIRLNNGGSSIQCETDKVNFYRKNHHYREIHPQGKFTSLFQLLEMNIQDGILKFEKGFIS